MRGLTTARKYAFLVFLGTALFVPSLKAQTVFGSLAEIHHRPYAKP